MVFQYIPHGVCSRRITVDIDEDGILRAVRFEGGCNGNTQGVSRLAEGKKAEDVIQLLKGIRCGMKPTSCPDQLAHALEQALNAQK